MSVAKGGGGVNVGWGCRVSGVGSRRGFLGCLVAELLRFFSDTRLPTNDTRAKFSSPTPDTRRATPAPSLIMRAAGGTNVQTFPLFLDFSFSCFGAVLCGRAGRLRDHGRDDSSG